MSEKSIKKEQKFVIYCRVSTREQGISGLGLDSQLDTCRKYIESKSGEILGEYNDIKSGSSKNRQGLLKALSAAKTNDATVVFAKLDRMSRESEYAHSIRNSGVPLYFCDFPEINSLLFSILVAVAQYEKELGQGRTKSALAQIKKEIAQTGSYTSKNGNTITSLGRVKGSTGRSTRDAVNAAFKNKIGTDPNRRRQFLTIKSLHDRGDTLASITATLNATEEPAPRGGRWSIGMISRALNDWPKYFLS